jgi:5-(carboxyamino)imidazole ribonucleotide synthase
MTAVYVLGNGQLGGMLLESGRRLGIEMVLLTPEHPIALPADVIITAEREHWPDNDFTTQIQQHPGWLNAQAFAQLTDRRQQKILLDQLNLPTARWLQTGAETTIETLHQILGSDVFLKRSSGGYDGRGQCRLKQGSNTVLPEWITDAIAEERIDFITEVSLIGARSKSGQVTFYELTENFHANGILQISLKTPGKFQHLQQDAERMLTILMEHLDYTGVMAVEFFLTENGLLINEIAPRVHNSGHWTQAGASISQFEMHLRAVCDLPLPRAEQPGHSLMVNLIGLQQNPAWLNLSGSQLHWYGKEARAGRKLGHINFHHPKPEKLREWLNDPALSDVYGDATKWALQQLSSSSLIPQAADSILPQTASSGPEDDWLTPELGVAQLNN